MAGQLKPMPGGVYCAKGFRVPAHNPTHGAPWHIATECAPHRGLNAENAHCKNQACAPPQNWAGRARGSSLEPQDRCAPGAVEGWARLCFRGLWPKACPTRKNGGGGPKLGPSSFSTCCAQTPRPNPRALGFRDHGSYTLTLTSGVEAGGPP